MKADTVPIMRELPADKQRVTKIQRRGNFLDVGEAVTAGTPAAFPPLPADMPANRLALAQWLVDENNPLTARVVVESLLGADFWDWDRGHERGFWLAGRSADAPRAVGLAGQRVGRIALGHEGAGAAAGDFGQPIGNRRW